MLCFFDIFILLNVQLNIPVIMNVKTHSKQASFLRYKSVHLLLLVNLLKHTYPKMKTVSLFGVHIKRMLEVGKESGESAAQTALRMESSPPPAHENEVLILLPLLSIAKLPLTPTWA